MAPVDAAGTCRMPVPVFAVPLLDIRELPNIELPNIAAQQPLSASVNRSVLATAALLE